MSHFHPQRPDSSAPTYRPAGFFLLRAPVLPFDDFVTLTAAGASYQVLLELAARPLVRQAVMVASPSLGERVAKLTAHPADVSPAVAAGDGATGDGATRDGARRDKKTDRALSSLLRYAVRMSTRPTPYGLFAGVALGTFGDRADLTLADEPVSTTRTRADIGWLLALGRRLETDPAAYRRLSVGVNDLLYRVGDRLLLPGSGVHGRQDDQLVDIRMTEVVEVVLELAGGDRGSTLAELAEELRQRYPEATSAQIDGLLDRLWELHVLVSRLRPRLTDPHPERGLLREIEGQGLIGEVSASLSAFRAAAEQIDIAPGGADPQLLDRLVADQRRTAPEHTAEIYQLDTALALTGQQLPAVVADTVAEAAELLVRLSPGTRPHHIVEYHSAFLERYGLGAEVPLTELLDAETGLDAPSGYTAPRQQAPLPAVPPTETLRSDAARMALLAEALGQARPEIELTDELIRALTPSAPGEDQAAVPASLDVYVQLAAASPEAIARGDFTLVVTPGLTVAGGRTAGRFADLLTGGADRLTDLAHAEQALEPDVVYAEVNYVPAHGRSGNVAVHPSVRHHEICVNTAPTLPTDRQILLGDVLVGATADRFYLRSRRHPGELRVSQGHMLTEIYAPNPVRLLLELSVDGCRPCPSFDWGPAGGAPYLPRLRSRRIVLHPAQWNLSVGLLIGCKPGGPLPAADAFVPLLHRWRTAWRVPRRVYLTFLDNRLLLDLDHPASVTELYEELRRAVRSDPRARVVLQEMLPAPDQLWLGDGAGRRYVSELVTTVVAADPAAVRRPPVRLPPTDRPVTRSDRRQLPGGDWTHLKLYAAPGRHDDLLTERVAELVAPLLAAGAVDRWFFIRYADPAPHLRIRLHAANPDWRSDVLQHTLGWAGTLIDASLASDAALGSYDREIERYGGPEAIDWMEELFFADSEVALSLLGLLRAADLDPLVAGIVGMHRLCEDWGLDPMSEVRPGQDVDVPDDVREHFRLVQPTLCDLLVPWDAHPDPAARAHRDTLEQLFATRQPAAHLAGERVRKLDETGTVWSDERAIVSSLLHMHLNRLLGIDPQRETLAHQLWALARRSIGRRPGTPAPSTRRDLSKEDGRR